MICYDLFSKKVLRIFNYFLSDSIQIQNVMPLITMQYKISQINNLEALQDIYSKYLRNDLNIFLKVKTNIRGLQV